MHTSVRWLVLVLGWGCSFPSMATAERFDQLVAALDRGEVFLSDTKAAMDYIGQLQAELPANDAKRQLRLEREACQWRFDKAPAQGIAFANRYIQDEALRTDFLNLAYFYQCRAYYHASLGQLAEQDEDIRQASALAAKSEDQLARASIALFAAEASSLRGQHADALVQLFQAYDLFKQLQQRAGIGYSLESIATAYRRMGEYDKALEYLEQSEKEFVSPDDKSRLLTLLQQKAFIFADLGQTPEARRLFHRVRQMLVDLGEEQYVISTDIDLMWIANLEGKYADTIELASSVQQRLDERARNNEGLVINQSLFPLYLAEARAALGQIDQALMLFQQAEQLLQQSPNPRYLLLLNRSWAFAQAKAGNYEQAFTRLSQVLQLQDELNSQIKQQREALLRYQFDSDLQKSKNHELEAEQKLTEQQLQTMAAAQRWQYTAIVLFVVLAIIALFYAISQILRNKRLQRLALTDELTQVANRRSILSYIREVQQRCDQQMQPWSLLIADIDHFKLCNDTYGHDAGDEVLCYVAQAMQQSLRHQDQVGRSGGEEFLLVLPETTQHQAMEIADRVRQRVEQLRFERYPQIQVTISIGVTQAARHEELRETIARADKALYEAKDSGRNQVVAH